MRKKVKVSEKFKFSNLEKFDGSSFVTERGGVNQLPMPILKFFFNKTYANN